MHVSNLDAAKPFRTTDGSVIRELAGRVSLPSANQSLAEASLPVGGATDEHYHPIAEELYFFLAGHGSDAAWRRAARGGARRLRPDRARRHPQDSEHERRAATSAVLLLAAMDARRHRAHRRLMRPGARSVGALLAALAMLTSPAGASAEAPAPPTPPAPPPALAPLVPAPPAPLLPGGVRVGIGDQKADMFSDPRFVALGVRYARIAVGWDVMTTPWELEALDNWLQKARVLNVQPLISIGHSRTQRRSLPSPERLKYEFRTMRERFPWVKTYATWNEANHCGEPVLPPAAARGVLLPRAAARVPVVHDPRPGDP